MAKSVAQDFVIGGFSQIGTGARDYGMGVVRIDHRFMASHPVAAHWPRHALLRMQVEKEDGARQVYGMLRAIDPAELPETPAPLLCLEYDDRLLLGVEKGDKVTIGVSKAGLWGRYKYFRDHPNIVVRSYTRYTFLTGIFTALLGAMTWALFRGLGF
jgi:hypothetical protein